jgi:hypothetical protein
MCAVLGSWQLATHTRGTTAPHHRAILSPSDPAHLLASATKPTAQLSGTTTLGPCVVGGRLGADAAAGKLTGWGVGLSYTWLAASRPAAAAGEAAAADKPVERLSAQQVGAVCWFVWQWLRMACGSRAHGAWRACTPGAWAHAHAQSTLVCPTWRVGAPPVGCPTCM